MILVEVSLSDKIFTTFQAADKPKECEIVNHVVYWLPFRKNGLLRFGMEENVKI